MKKRLILLGATGSIGHNAVAVVKAHESRFEVVGVSAGSKVQELADLAQLFKGAKTALEVPGGTADFNGPGAAEALVRRTDADIVLNGISGAAGLAPSIAALETGKDLALANKETIVMAGPLVLALAEQRGRKVLPVDSEHSTIFQLIQAHGAGSVEEVVLTASGGPFRTLPKEQFATITAQDALAHPTWNMGGKISIDSATLANKGLEVIEAVRLFGLPASKVKVVVHPQSIIHSLIRVRDASLFAQLSKPDMRLPIQNALLWPDMEPCPSARLDLVGQTLSFETPDTDRFPLLPLAYKAVELDGLYTVAYNAADEIAVAAFLAGKIAFNSIPSVVESVLASDWSLTVTELNVETIRWGDRRAREFANMAVQEMSL